jgi:hypothetical protein
VKAFLKIAEGIDTIPLQLELQRNPGLWDRETYRRYTGPHNGMVDIWARFRDLEQYRKEYGDDYSHFTDEHESIWLPPYYTLPALKPLVFGLMTRVEGERLGGVLITKLPAGGKIKPHVDSGWHASHYDKYYIAVKNEPGALFCWDNETIHAKTGDCYMFRNDLSHWVNNDSVDERIALIVCIRSHRA